MQLKIKLDFESNLNDLKIGRKSEEQIQTSGKVKNKILRIFMMNEKRPLGFIKIIMQLYDARYDAIHRKGLYH